MFVGDFSGAIHMLKLDSGEEFKFITSLIGHAGYGLLLLFGYNLK